MVAAVVMAALLGTAAPAAMAAEAAPPSGAASASVAPQLAATEPVRRES
ncbi:hypothetical protein [Arthrobacter nitrophenolicus]|nr:hypothetical protein [Arthrobacter nitrophenolicus]